MAPLLVASRPGRLSGRPGHPMSHLLNRLTFREAPRRSQWTCREPSDIIASTAGSRNSAMKLQFERRLFCLCVAASLAAVPAALPVDSAEPPPEKFDCPLFDGRSLDGWTAENGCEAAVERELLVLR